MTGITFLLSASIVAATLGQPYANPRFGAAATVPSGWKAQPPPENGDGQTFVSPDGQAQVSVYGSYDMGDGDTARIVMQPNAGETIAYRFHKGNVYVVSGTANGRIFYRRMEQVCNGQVWIGVAFDYPVRQAKTYNTLAAKSAATLHEQPGGCEAATH